MIELLLILGAAFLGGLLLNTAPCVLPVLPLKIWHFQKLAGESRFVLFMHGLLYSLGIVMSFLLLAAIVVGIQWAGGFAWFGFHMQSPWLIGALACITGAMGAHLLGLFKLLKKVYSGLR